MIFTLWIEYEREKLQQRKPIVQHFQTTQLDRFQRVVVNVFVNVVFPRVDRVVGQYPTKGYLKAVAEKTLTRLALSVQLAILN